MKRLHLIAENYQRNLRTSEDYAIHSMILEHYLYEDAHVLNTIDVPTDEIFEMFILPLWKICQINPENADASSKYTGFNMFPKYDSYDDPTIEYVKNKSIGFPIYIEYTYENNFNIRGHAIHRNHYIKNDDDIISVDMSWKEIHIRLNVFLLCQYDIDDNYNQFSIKNILSHEMQHAYEMYLLPDHNIYDNKKNSIYKDYQNDIFNLKKIDTSLYNELLSVMYLISPPEMRVKVKEYDNYLQWFKTSPNKQKTLEDNSKRVYNSQSLKMNLSNVPDEIINTILILSVLKDSKSLQMSNLKIFFTKITPYIYCEDDSKDKALIIIGYYLYTHNMLKFDKHKLLKSTGLTTKHIESFFRYQNIYNFLNYKESDLRFNERYEDIIFLIKHTLETMFLRYERVIFNRTDKNLDDIFKGLTDKIVHITRTENKHLLHPTDLLTEEKKILYNKIMNEVAKTVKKHIESDYIY